MRIFAALPLAPAPGQSMPTTIFATAKDAAFAPCAFLSPAIHATANGRWHASRFREATREVRFF